MPYQASLHQYVEPGFYAEPPESWERRLRELSPEMPGLDRLVLRCIDPTNPDGSDRGWNCKDRPQWVLYAAKPLHLVEPGRKEQFTKHWSELATEGERVARRVVVSDYQHFMWHTKGLYVRPFLVLQGEWGGTPAKYSDKEIAFLEASDCFSEPFPIGSFPACPFDDRTVQTIVMRDRLLRCSNSYEDLANLDAPLAMKNETAEAELLRRRTFLDTWKEVMRPSVEFMQRFMHTKEADRVLPRAPEGTNDAVAQFREHWLEHGSWVGVQPAHMRRVSVGT